jgi:proteasome lid subunit RPN8/RPN11
VEYCRLQLPNEACGAFFGTLEQDFIIIEDFMAITNVAACPSNHFVFDRDPLLQLLYASKKLPWIGVFHSHPSTAPYPSDEDLRYLWQKPVYAIISFLQPNQPIMKSYEILPQQQKKPYSIQEQTIEIYHSLTLS